MRGFSTKQSEGCRVSWKQALFGLLGKDPEAVVVSFASGDCKLVRKMAEEVRTLEPNRRHYLVCLDEPIEVAGITCLVVSSRDPYPEARRALRRSRIGLAPVLFDGSDHPLLRVAALLAPLKILAFNRRLERHHLSFKRPIASWLFYRGVALDRIWLRPWSGGDGYASAKYQTLDGRAWRSGRKRIGIVSPYFPWPLSHGGAVRIFYLLREASKEFDIVLYAFGEPSGVVMDFVSKAYLFELPRYRKPRWSSLLPAEVCEYDSTTLRQLLETSRKELGLSLVQVEYTPLANYPGEVLVEHDVTFDLYDQVAAREHTLGAYWNAWRWRRFEQAAVRRFDCVVTMAQKDAAQLPNANTRVIPNGVDLTRFCATEEVAGHNVLFIGSFRHFPNIEAFRFFSEQVWPLVRVQFPEAEFTAVAGPDPETYWRGFTADPFPAADGGVKVLGFVADVVPLYERTNLVVAPTLVSAGTNLKVLEAMAMQRAVVATSSGCQGLELQHDVSVWVADDAAAFADGVCQLLRSAATRRRIAGNAYTAAQQFDWAAIGKLQCAAWQELIDAK